jgi:hypothetical protein
VWRKTAALVMNIDDMSKRLKAIERKSIKKTNSSLATFKLPGLSAFLRLPQAVLLWPFSIFRQEEYFDY